MKLEKIGVVRSPYKTLEEAPYQGAGRPEVAEIEIFREYSDGLMGIERFKRIIVLYYFHKSRGYELLTTTPRSRELRGVFATRSPRRPSAVGLCVVELLERKKNVLKVRGLDAIDKTPVIDIKPYFPSIDSPQDAEEG